MSRDNVVSIRVTDAEMDRIRDLGGPSAVLRGALNNAANPLPPMRLLPITTNGLAPSPVFIQWNNGAIGATYPAVMTG